MPEGMDGEGNVVTVERFEVREPLNVVPVRVAEQQVEAGDGTFEQRLAEVADARTGIDDDGAIVGLDLDVPP